MFYRQKYIAMKCFEYSAIAGVSTCFAFIAFVSSVTISKISVVTTLKGLSFLITIIGNKLYAGVVFGAADVVLIGL